MAVTALLHLTRTQNNAYVMSYLRARANFSIAELGLSQFTAARIVTMSIDQFEVSSVIRGHHVYKHNWSPFNGEELTCLREEGNDKDCYSVAVTKSGSGVVGRVQRRISAACALFLQKGGSICCTVTGARRYYNMPRIEYAICALTIILAVH